MCLVCTRAGCACMFHERVGVFWSVGRWVQHLYCCCTHSHTGCVVFGAGDKPRPLLDFFMRLSRGFFSHFSFSLFSHFFSPFVWFFFFPDFSSCFPFSPFLFFHEHVRIFSILSASPALLNRVRQFDFVERTKVQDVLSCCLVCVVRRILVPVYCVILFRTSMHLHFYRYAASSCYGLPGTISC